MKYAVSLPPPQKKNQTLRSGLKSDSKMPAKDPKRINNRMVVKKSVFKSRL